MKNYLLFTTLFFSIYCSCQNNIINSKPTLHAENELNIALSKQSQHNIINNGENIVKDSATAINIAEIVLFNIFGKENIEKQKPYEIDFIRNYWIIEGSLPQGFKGGTFIIILNAKDAKIIKISHGK